VLVADRDRSPGEVRDISLLRLDRGGWGGPAPLHADGWTVRACPVNGPALASAGSRVAAAWYTAEGDRPRVLVAFSEDGGSRFGAPIAVDRGAPLGRVEVAMLPDRSALVLWLGAEQAPSTGRRDGVIRVARVTASGKVEVPLAVARPSWARASGAPRMALARGRLVFAWTEAGSAEGPDAKPGPKQVRLAAARLSPTLRPGK